MYTPPLAPPNGTSTTAHLYVISAESALTSSSQTSKENRIPPLVGVLCSECCERQASIISY